MSTIIFQYPSVFDLPRLEQIITLDKVSSKEIANNYALIGLNDGDEPKDSHLCIIHEILYADFEKACQDNEEIAGELKSAYEALTNKYGKDDVDRLIVKDESVIQKKVKTILNLGCDVFKTDTLKVDLHLGFEKDNSWDEYSAMKNAIYSAAQESFDIIDQRLFDPIPYIIIKKRGEKNDYDAS